LPSTGPLFATEAVEICIHGRMKKVYVVKSTVLGYVSLVDSNDKKTGPLLDSLRKRPQ